MSGQRSGGIPVFANEAARGSARDGAAAIRSALAEAGIDAHVLACPPDALATHVREARDRGAPIIGVAGGDGSLRTAAQHLAGSRAVLAAVPAGTLNHFARRIGLETVADAVAAIAAGSVRTIAVGRVDDDVFLNTATFGLYADVLRLRERLRPWLGKWPAAALGFLVTLLRLRPVHLTLHADDTTMERETALVWVGIGYGSFPLVRAAAERRARPDLEVAVLRDAGRGSLFAFGMRTFWRVLRSNTQVPDRAIELLHVRSLSLASHRGRIGVTLDGEVMARRAQVRVSMENAALRVIAAATSVTPPR